MSIAIQILDTALAAAADNGAGRITALEIEAGAMKLIVPEALEAAWSAVTEGTSAEGSRLLVTEAPIEARCRDCGRAFSPSLDSFLCPGCGQADVEIIRGDEVILKSITCESVERDD